MPHAGRATLSFGSTTYRGDKASLYTMRFATSKFFDAIYRMRDTLNCYYTTDGVLLYAIKYADEGGSLLIDELTFAYSGNRTSVHSHRYTPVKTNIDTTLVTTSGYVFDMFGVIFYIRTLDISKFSPGDRVTARVATGRDLVTVACTYMGLSVVERDNRRYHTRLFTLDVYDETFEQSKSATEVWISDDDNHLPIKIRSKLKIGAAEIYYKSATGLKAPLKYEYSK